MRKTIAAAALGGFFALFGLAACADNPVVNESQSSPTATPTVATTGASGQTGNPAEVPADRKAACDTYLTAQAEVEASMLGLMTEFPEAAEDPDKAKALIGDLAAMLTTFETKLSAALTQSSGDAELEAAIQSDVKALQAVSAAVQAAGDDMEKALDALAAPEMENAGVAVTAICQA